MCWWLLRDHVLQNRNLNDKNVVIHMKNILNWVICQMLVFYKNFECIYWCTSKNQFSIWLNIIVKDSLARIWFILLSDDTISKIFRSRMSITNLPKLIAILKSDFNCNENVCLEMGGTNYMVKNWRHASNKWYKIIKMRVAINFFTDHVNPIRWSLVIYTSSKILWSLNYLSYIDGIKLISRNVICDFLA